MKKFINYLKKNPIVAISLIFIILCFVCAIFAPIVAPYGYNQTDYSSPLSPPSLKHFFGTDQLSRDIFSRMIYALRISLFVGIVPTTINLFIGSIIGTVSGLSNKWLDSILMRFTDLGLSFPFMILAMAIIYNLGSSLKSMVMALVIFGWTSTARIIRAQTKFIKNNPYIDAARIMEVPTSRMIFNHILPNMKSTLLVLYTMSVPQAILAEAGLSFLGFGAQPPMTSLGVMVSSGRSFLFHAPWLSIAPGVLIMLISLSFNFLGDGLRDFYGLGSSDI